MSFIDALKKKIRPAPKAGDRATALYSTFHPESFADWMDVNRIGQVLMASRSGDVSQLFALYRDILLTDSHFQGELSKRVLAVIGKPLRVLPWDKAAADDKAAAEFCEQSIAAVKSFRPTCAHLLSATMWPVAVVEKLFEADGSSFRLAGLIEVPHTLLDFTTGALLIRATDESGTPTGEYYAPDRDRYIVHRGHLLSESLDRFGGPMRSLVFWWLLSTMDRDWWARFLDRFGQPFLVGKYEQGNENERNLLLSAFRASARLFGLVVSRNTDIEIMAATKAGADAYDRFLAVCQREKSKLILGQSLSATPDATGMGSGVSELQGDVRDDIKDFDAMMLSDTLRDQLFTQVCTLAGLSGRPPTTTWGSIRPSELKAKADLLSALYLGGLEVDDAGIPELSEQVGLGLRRKAAGGPSLFGAGSGLRSQSADVVRMLCEFPAEAARIIRESASAEDCRHRLLEHYAAIDPARLVPLLDASVAMREALVASTSRSTK